MTKKKSFDWMARRGEQTNLIIGLLPTFPVRLQLLDAYNRAKGYDEVDVEVVEPESGSKSIRTEMRQVREVDTDDLQAVCYAALGCCWAQPELQVPITLRGCGRDVIAYGEHVMTALFDAGYRDWRGLIEAAHTCLDAIQDSILDAKKLEVEVAEGFGEAQQRG